MLPGLLRTPGPPELLGPLGPLGLSVLSVLSVQLGQSGQLKQNSIFKN